MKVFVYEYCTCQAGSAGVTVDSLRAEGLAMLSAIMTDLCRIPEIEPVALVAADLPAVTFPHRTASPSTEKRHFFSLAREADWTLIIAPEIDGILEKLCRRVLQAGGKLLGCAPDAVKLTADKYELSRIFLFNSVPTMPACLVEETPPGFPLVLKPRFGAGSLHTYLVRNPHELSRRLKGIADLPCILQPYISGTPVSVAFLIGPGVCLPLLPCGQSIEKKKGQLSYAGGWAPLEPALRDRATRLATRAVQSVAGLFGYVGVDLVLGTARSGKQDVVIEINPRLTTSYLGLRELYHSNLARAHLKAAQGTRSRLVRSRRSMRSSW